jgi:transcriptional regulator with PAS, ATPase and Fis domain
MKNTLLISWIAFGNDFEMDEGGRLKGPSEKGPTFQFHKNFFDHDKHIILYNEKDDTRAEFLGALLRRNFPDHAVELRAIKLGSVIDLAEIRQKVAQVLEEFKSYDVDIFFSPGTSIMQLAWYLCHTSLSHIKTRLIQTQAGRHSRDGKPQQFFIEIEKSITPVSLLSKQSDDKAATNDKIKLTDSIRSVYERAKKVAEADRITTLILGASGTGKEHLACTIHESSVRRSKPFIAVNCSSLGDELLSSTLFGHLKGAFTGAEKDKKGYFEEANGGTVFLDEIGDISPFMQQSLLRVLQAGEITAVGDTKTKKVDVRVIAATHKDLVRLCEEGKFRWDLYYRLAIAELELPTLQERGQVEKEAMLDYFLAAQKSKFNRSKKLKLSSEVKRELLAYSFPGNIRELENIVSSLYVFTEGNEVKTLDQLPKRLVRQKEKHSLRWQDVEKMHIEKVLALYNFNKSKALKALDYGSPNTLNSKIDLYGIEWKPKQG